MTFIVSEFLPVFLFFCFSVFLSCFILVASYCVARQSPYTEKFSAYECGFDPFNDARNQFDIRFYLVAILFLIFDLEASFIFPWVLVLGQISSFGFWSMFDFLIELTVGFIYAWKISALDWE